VAPPEINPAEDTDGGAVTRGHLGLFLCSIVSFDEPASVFSSPAGGGFCDGTIMLLAFAAEKPVQVGRLLARVDRG
jgi:hypothetical protein